MKPKKSGKISEYISKLKMKYIHLLKNVTTAEVDGEKFTLSAKVSTITDTIEWAFDCVRRN